MSPPSKEAIRLAYEALINAANTGIKLDNFENVYRYRFIISNISKEKRNWFPKEEEVLEFIKDELGLKSEDYSFFQVLSTRKNNIWLKKPLDISVLKSDRYKLSFSIVKDCFLLTLYGLKDVPIEFVKEFSKTIGESFHIWKENDVYKIYYTKVHEAMIFQNAFKFCDYSWDVSLKWNLIVKKRSTVYAVRDGLIRMKKKVIPVTEIEEASGLIESSLEESKEVAEKPVSPSQSRKSSPRSSRRVLGKNRKTDNFGDSPEKKKPKHRNENEKEIVEINDDDVMLVEDVDGGAPPKSSNNGC